MKERKTENLAAMLRGSLEPPTVSGTTGTHRQVRMVGVVKAWSGRPGQVAGPVPRSPPVSVNM